MKNKRAYEISTNTLILFIVLVCSFAIILFFWGQINPGGDIDKETCHTSVVLRGTASSETFKTEFRDVIPLKCKTEKLCLTSGLFSDGCESLGKQAQKINVGGDKDKILDTLAEGIYSWHMTLGEGKINFMPNNMLETNYCFIGSVISFDPEVQKKLGEKNIQITLYDLYNKLSEKKNAEGDSYFSVIYPMYGFSTIDEVLIRNPSSLSGTLNAPLDLSENYALIAQEITVGKWKAYVPATTGVAVAGVTAILYLSGVGTPIAAAITVAGSLGVGFHGFFNLKPNPDAVYVYNAPVLIKYTKEELSSFECDSFETLS